MNKIAKRVIFKGHVQGVGFRYTVLRIAQGLELCGYVKNLPDGSVEAWFQGTAAKVNACLREVDDYFSGSIRDKIINTRPAITSYYDFRIAY